MGVDERGGVGRGGERDDEGWRGKGEGRRSG